MQTFIYFFMIFALCLATDVSVYDGFNLRINSEPMIASAFPWKFQYSGSEQLYMIILQKNMPPSVTSVQAKFGPLLKSFVASNLTLPMAENAVNMFVAQFDGTEEATIDLQLNTSNGLCTTKRIAEGRVRSEKTDNNYKYTDICSKGIDKPCVLVVNLKDFICEGTLVTGKVNTTTARPATDLITTNKATSNDTSNFVFIILIVSVFLTDQRLTVMAYLFS